MALDFSTTTDWNYTYASPAHGRVTAYGAGVLSFVEGGFSAAKLMVYGAMPSLGGVFTAVAGRYAGPVMMKVSTFPKDNTLTFVAGLYSALRGMKAAALALSPASTFRAQYMYQYDPDPVAVTPPATTIYSFWS